jgi:hypothetical protein
MTITGVTNSQFAALDGCSEKRIRTGRRRGELPILPDGSLDPALAGSPWRARTRRADGASEPTRGAARKPSPKPGTLADAERLREIALARLRRQELETRRNEWVERAVVTSTWRATALGLRRELAPIAAAVAPLVPGASLPAIAKALHDAIFSTLNAICDCAAHKPPAPAAGRSAPAIGDRATRLEAEREKARVATEAHRLDLAIATGTALRLADLAAAFGRACAVVRARLLQAEGLLPPKLLHRSEADARRIIASYVTEAADNLPLGPPATLAGRPSRATRRRAGRKARR